MSDLQQLRDVWDNLSLRYSARTAEEDSVSLPSGLLPNSGDRILDVGCGAGVHMAIFSQVGAAVFGIDISPGMLLFARRHGTVSISDIRHLPYRDDTFDYVFSWVAINYVPDWSAAVAEMARVLKPGGRCIVAGANRYSLLAPVRHLLNWAGAYRLGKHYHTSIKDIARAGRSSGLTVLDSMCGMKKVTSDAKARARVYGIITAADKIINQVVPSWGGDSIVVFTKQGTES